MIHAGIRALVSLDGAPLAPADLRALGLPQATGTIAVLASDIAQPQAVHAASDASGTTLLLGFFDEPDQLAARLGLSETGDPIQLARAALHRFGPDLPVAATGEWSLLHWTPGDGLTLMGSLARRDPVFFVRRGALVAVGPSVHALGRLGWVDRAICPEGFLSAVATFRLREAQADRTVLREVRRLPPGGSVHLHEHGESAYQAQRPAPPARFAGTIADAAEEAYALLGQVVSERLSRLAGAASLLSGGLDSALVAVLLSESRGGSAPLDFLCSAAPPGSGMADELALARSVGDHLGLPVHAVVPAAEASPYRPARWRFEQSGGLVHAVRHYLYDALAERAAAIGHRSLFDGMFGELTVTGQWPLATPRQRLAQLARRLRGRRDPWYLEAFPSFVRLSAHRAARLNERIAALDGGGELQIEPLPRRARWRFPPGESLRTGPATELLPGRLRSELIFRDQRLWRLFAGFPAAFLEHRGMDRALVRLMLAGRLPEAVRLQPKGIGISPDYDLRLMRHAPEARSRVALYRRAGLDDWLDLEWLDTELGRIAARGPADQFTAQSAQLTAMTAEFLLWWREDRD